MSTLQTAGCFQAIIGMSIHRDTPWLCQNKKSDLLALKAFLSAYLCNLMCLKMWVCANQELPPRQLSFQEAWYLYGFVNIFLARPGILFKECYSIQNTFAVITSVKLQPESVTVSSRESC